MTINYQMFQLKKKNNPLLLQQQPAPSFVQILKHKEASKEILPYDSSEQVVYIRSMID